MWYLSNRFIFFYFTNYIGQTLLYSNTLPSATIPKNISKELLLPLNKKCGTYTLNISKAQKSLMISAYTDDVPMLYVQWDVEAILAALYSHNFDYIQTTQELMNSSNISKHWKYKFMTHEELDYFMNQTSKQ